MSGMNTANTSNDQRHRHLELSRKRERNSLAPISQLPVELMRQIFLLCVRSHPISTTLFRICSISHAWREIALGSTELWATFTILPTSPAALIAFMFERAGKRGRKLTVLTGSPSNSDDLPLLGATSLDRELQSNASRLKWLNFVSSAAGLERVLRDLPPHTILENLECLLVYIPDYLTQPWDGGSLFKCTAPRLRIVAVRTTVHPWDFPLFRTATLEAVKVETLEEGSAKSFMAWLERSPSLTALSLCARWREDVAGLGMRKALRLSSVRHFHLRAMSWTVPLAILRLIRLDPAVISRVAFAGLGPRTPTWIEDFWSAFQQVFALVGCFSPLRITFSKFRVVGAHVLPHERIIIEAFQPRSSPKGLAVGLDLSADDGHDLFSSPSQFDQIWSFNTLKSITIIDGASLPAGLWNLLRRSPALQSMCIDPQVFPEAFPALLMGAHDHADATVLAPFPGLLHIIWRSVPSEWRPLRYEARSCPPQTPCTGVQAQEQYLLDVIYALRVRRRTMESEENPKNARLDLRVQGVMHHIPEEILRELLAVVRPDVPSYS